MIRRSAHVLCSAALLAASAAVTAQQPTFRAATMAVQIDAAVSSNRHVVTGLTVNDFELLDNGVRQSLIDVTRDQLPLDVTLVIDTSGSTKGTVFAALTEGVKRVRDSLRKEDRAALVTFNHRLSEQSGLGPPKSLASLDHARADGQTSLYDAVAMTILAPPVVDRRQMVIVFTDGMDTMSFLEEKTVLELARRSTTAIFVLAYSAAPSLLPAGFFESIAQTTGGVAVIRQQPSIQVVANGVPVGGPSASIEKGFLDLITDFRSSYTLRYTAEGVPRGGWHEVTVRVTRRDRPYIVRTKLGYVGG